MRLLLIVIRFVIVTVLPELKSITALLTLLTLIVRLLVNPDDGASIFRLDSVTLIVVVSAEGTSIFVLPRV